MSHLAEQLVDFDGKDTALLGSVRDAAPKDRSPLDAAIDLIGSGSHNEAIGASWLLRAWLERGDESSPSQAMKLGRRLHSIDEPWTAQHICQSIRHLQIRKGATAERFADFLQRCIGSERPFLRAWAVDGLERLANKHPHYAAAADSALTAALEDDAASVRARARNILSER